MSEDKAKNTPDPKTPEGLDQGGKDGGQSDDKTKDKLFDQEKVDSIVSERLAKEKEKFDKTLQAEVAKAVEQAERRAKLSQEEKEAELLEEEKRKTAERAKEILLRENSLEGREKLVELGLPKDLIEIVINEDKDKMFEGIDLLNKVVNDLADAKVKETIKGETPKDPSSNPTKSDQEVDGKNYF